MLDVRQAIAILRSNPKLRSLELDHKGQAEIVVEELLSVYLTRVSETDLDLSGWIEELDGAVDAALTKRLLVANAVGGPTGSGRFALDEAGERVMFVQRLDLRGVDADLLEKVFTDFVRRVAFWRSAGLADLTGPATDRDEAPTAPPPAFGDISVIRI